MRLNKEYSQRNQTLAKQIQSFASLYQKVELVGMSTDSLSKSMEGTASLAMALIKSHELLMDLEAGREAMVAIRY